MIDPSLVRLAREGDVEAFMALVGHCETRAYRIALAFTRNAEDAADILQDTMVSALRQIATLHDEARADAWIYRIATNRSLMLLRSRRRRPEVSMDGVEGHFDSDGHRDGFVPAWPVDPEDELERRRLAARIAELSERLPDSYRAIWTLADVEQLTMEEIAGVLELSIPNVKSRLHRARLALRQLLAGELLTPGGVS
ncbi:MAG: sigma-70 family RNA polymerase sigma factor [Deltaproteobacteria bacterium]|nr:sigma-70 family RNA polymerase sigma factor [Deltaproteobacteria bacterium]